MKTQYEIRNPRLDGIFISFDTEWEAMRYWRENVERVPETNLIHGAVVVRHSWEPKHEAETARLNWLLGPGSLAALNAECERAPALYENPATWLDAARTAIDICRKSPPSTATVIWPNSEGQPTRHLMRTVGQAEATTQEPRAGWLSRLVGRFRSFDNTSRCTQSGGSLSPMIHEYAVRSGHPMTRTISAAPTRLHWLTKSMNRAKEKLHNVQEKTCDALHTVQCGGMKHAARIEAEKKLAIAAAAMKRAEMGTDESAYLATVAAWKSSIAELVAAEMAHPTARESARRANIIRLENRGLAA